MYVYGMWCLAKSQKQNENTTYERKKQKNQGKEKEKQKRKSLGRVLTIKSYLFFLIFVRNQFTS